MPAIPEGKKGAGSLSTPQMDTTLGFVRVRKRGDRLAQPAAKALVTEMLAYTDTTPFHCAQALLEKAMRAAKERLSCVPGSLLPMCPWWCLTVHALHLLCSKHQCRG